MVHTHAHTHAYTHVLQSDSDTDQIHHIIFPLILSQVGFGIQKVRACGQGRQEGIVGETWLLINPFFSRWVPWSRPQDERNSGSGKESNVQSDLRCSLLIGKGFEKAAISICIYVSVGNASAGSV